MIFWVIVGLAWCLACRDKGSFSQRDWELATAFMLTRAMEQEGDRSWVGKECQEREEMCKAKSSLVGQLCIMLLTIFPLVALLCLVLSSSVWSGSCHDKWMGEKGECVIG